MRAFPIVNRQGKAAGPSMEAVIDRATSLSRPRFICVSDKAVLRAEVKEFIQRFLKDGCWRRAGGRHHNQRSTGARRQALESMDKLHWRD